MAKMSLRSRAIQNKHWLRLGAIASVIVAVAVGAAFVTTGNQRPSRSELPQTKPLATGITGLNRKAWETGTGADIVRLRKDFEDYKRTTAGGVTIKPNGGANASASQPDAGLAEEGGDTRRTPGPPQKPELDNHDATSLLAQLRKPKAPTLKGSPPAGNLFTQAGNGDLTPPIAPTGQAGGAAVAPQERTLESLPITTTAAPAKPGEDGEDETSTAAARNEGDTYVPAGTFVRALLLNGLDAPAGGQAQANAAPVLLSAVADAQGANGYRSVLKRCTITGNGYGDISAERAYLRTDRLSCVGPAGAIDIPVKGYIVGEDGKTGVRGIVVTKTGQVLANALYASIGSGLAAAFRAEGVQTTTNALGTTEQTTDAFKAGVGTGLGKSMDKLSDYYIKLADKMFPVVEVSGSRVVEIVFTRGFILPAVNGSKKLAVTATRDK
jgi:conjugal transfer pilus assembly protein TraB